MFLKEMLVLLRLMWLKEKGWGKGASSFSSCRGRNKKTRSVEELGGLFKKKKKGDC